MSPETRPYEQGRISPPINRANQLRRDNDTVKMPRVSIFDIDYAIFWHLSENIQPRIQENGSIIPVPIYFANAEKWAQIRGQGFMRDANKKVLAPAIVIRRTNIANDDRLPMVGLNARGPQVFRPKVKLIPHKTMGMQWDKVAGQYVSKESFEYYLVDLPEYVRVGYEVIFWTDLMEQMNELLQPIIGVSDHVWGDFYKFRTNVQDITHDNVNIPGEDRLIKSTMTLQVDGYLRAEYEYHQSKIQKQYSMKRVKFLSEGSEQVIQEDLSGIDTNRPYFDRSISDTTPLEQQNQLRRKIRF